MARKQSDYLADILGDEGTNGPVEAPERPDASPAPSAPSKGSTGSQRAGMSLLGRESALARVASGEVKQVTQLLLDPARARIWSGNARMQARLNEDNCRDLIDSILSEGGQKVPAVVRRVLGNPDFDYEVIAGTRRHFAISWLRANSYPEMKLLAQVADMDDEAAFRLADIENRARKDVSDIERARNYAQAIADHYGGKQRRMAERLHLSEGWLSKMLAVARLPDQVIHAFASPSDIQLKPAYPLAKWIAEDAHSEVAVARARTLAAEQDKRRAQDKPLLGAADIIRQIMHGLDSEAAPSPALPSIQAANGRPVLSVASRNRQGITLRLHAGSGASHDELAAALKTILQTLEEDGKALQT
jgi:ParB family transcriptional regulator, chromosome partitioning protein